MARDVQGMRLAAEVCETDPGFLHFAGFRYWAASLLPALVGTTLPFWLRPPGFSFKWLGAIEFVIATVLFHAGFSFLQAHFQGRSSVDGPGSRLLTTGGVCIAAGCLVVVHLNNGLTLHRGVLGYIFIVYGLSALFVGVLYVSPPFSLCRRAGREVVLSVSLGLVPVLGAYLIQIGDITRRVYLASLPLVVAIALWVWTGEHVTRIDDGQAGRGTMVLLLGPRFSGRLVVPALSTLLYATLFLAIFTTSISPAALIALLSLGLVWKVAAVSWKEYASPARMLEAHRNAFSLVVVTGVIVAATSLVAVCR